MESEENFYTWLAGFWEGEGCVSYSTSKYFGLSQSGDRGKLIIERIAKITRVGKIRHHRPKGGTSEAWEWRVFSYQDISLIVRKLLPYLQFRREEVLEFLRKIETRAGRKQIHNRWTENDNATLRKNHLSKDTATALILNRTPEAVKAQREKLGLVRNGNGVSCTHCGGKIA